MPGKGLNSMKLTKWLTIVLYFGMIFCLSLQPLPEVSAQSLEHTNVDSAELTEIVRGWLHPADEDTSQNNQPIENVEKVVYLTFDDGPDPVWTIQILRLLERYQAKATFYMIGYNVVSHPEVVREIARRGQTIGVHGFNHYDLSAAGYSYFYAEVHDTEMAITDAMQGNPELVKQLGHCMRPPYGRKSALLSTNAEAMGYEVSMWNIDTKDWTGLEPEVILRHLRDALEPDKVILMHDGGLARENTVEALELILHELLMQGYNALPYCTQNGQAIKSP